MTKKVTNNPGTGTPVLFVESGAQIPSAGKEDIPRDGSAVALLGAIAHADSAIGLQKNAGRFSSSVVLAPRLAQSGVVPFGDASAGLSLYALPGDFLNPPDAVLWFGGLLGESGTGFLQAGKTVHRMFVENGGIGLTTVFTPV